MQIDFKEQSAKHNSPIRLNREPASNVIVVIWLFEKHPLSKSSTEFGMQIDLQEQFEKHNSPTQLN
jgi:hypothetical protein